MALPAPDAPPSRRVLPRWMSRRTLGLRRRIARSPCWGFGDPGTREGFSLYRLQTLNICLGIWKIRGWRFFNSASKRLFLFFLLFYQHPFLSEPNMP